MNEITTPAHRIAYVVGPFLSPFSSPGEHGCYDFGFYYVRSILMWEMYSTLLSYCSYPAMDSPNLIAVASGIGVTPAISLVQKYSQETLRRVNLVWICRDPGLIEHFITNIGE